MNSITLIGNVVHTPDSRTTNTGKAVCKFSIAVNRRFRAASGEQMTDFFDVQVWDKLANVCANYLDKGKKVCVRGEMQCRKYDGRDGSKKTAWSVNAEEVEFLTPRSDSVVEAQAAPVQPAQGFTEVEDDELPF